MPRYIPLLTLTFLACFGVSFGQVPLSVPSGLRDCREIADAAQRLACFDESASRTDPGATTPTNEPPRPNRGTWDISTEIDLITGLSKVVAFQLPQSRNGTRERVGWLAVRCGYSRQGELDVMFDPGMYLGVPAGARGASSDRIRIMRRFDQVSPVEDEWIPSTNRLSAHSPAPRRFFEIMRRHDTIALQATALHTGERAASLFRIEGIEEVARAMAACLPSLPTPEITRSHGIEFDWLAPNTRWTILPRVPGEPSQGSMITYYTGYDETTGNQQSTSFWCEGPNIVNRIRSLSEVNPPLSRLNIYWARTLNGRSADENVIGYVMIDRRTIAHPDSRRLIRQILELNETERGFGFVSGADSRSSYFSSMIRSNGFADIYREVLAPCLASPPPSQAPASQRQRRG